MLLFKKKFLAAIARGEKTQTIRLWKYRKMRAGQRSYIPGVGYISVLSVDEVTLPELTEDDARLDGFDSADALRAEIQNLYGAALAAGSHAFRVRFRVLDPREQAEAVAERESRRTPSSG
ncbi:MAG TPA: ASCH domain-containing protein [Pirellulales bacterium]|nr:ASCH domain-containing protein [Pirellulales bacterium]